MKTVHLEISEQQWRQFTAQCRLAGATIGKTVAALIERWIKEGGDKS